MNSNNSNPLIDDSIPEAEVSTHLGSVLLKFEDCFEKTENADRRKCRLCKVEIGKRSFNLKRHISRSHKSYYDAIMYNIEKQSQILELEKAACLEICEDESQTNTQSSCDRRSSQSSPAPAGMAGPYLLKKETHCTTILDQLLRDDTFCDVTLTAEGQSMRAHKIVLCLASAYFRQVLNKEPTVQNVIVFRDIKFMELKNLINFIYTGEATVDAADLESFMKTAEMLEVTSLCDGQRKIPKNLIPKQKEPDNEKGKTTFASKRSAHNSCVSPPPSKARKIDDTPKCAPKSATHPSTSGGGIQYQPQLILHTTTPIKTEPPSEEEQTEDYSTFEESEMPSPTCQLSVTPPSVDPGSSSDKLPVGKCPFCPSSQHLLKGLELTNHMSTYHPEKTVFTCETCSLVFLKKGAFEAHQDDCNR